MSLTDEDIAFLNQDRADHRSTSKRNKTYQAVEATE
jgi:hypothetical protein